MCDNGINNWNFRQSNKSCKENFGSQARKSFNRFTTKDCEPGSSVGIATGYGLGGLGIESRKGARFSEPVPTSSGAHQISCTMGTGSFPGVKSGWGVTLTPHPLLVPWSWKSRAIPLLLLWVVRPVQSLSACTRVTCTFTFTFTKKGSCTCYFTHDTECTAVWNFKPERWE